jgi:hypothetical protein
MTMLEAVTLPKPQYEILRLPDGRHSGARFDPVRGVLEIQYKGSKYLFDLAQIKEAIDEKKNVCYDTCSGGSNR